MNNHNIPEAQGLVKVATTIDGNDIYLPEGLVYAESETDYLAHVLVEFAKFDITLADMNAVLEKVIDILRRSDFRQLDSLIARLSWITNRLVTERRIVKVRRWWNNIARRIE